MLRREKRQMILRRKRKIIMPIPGRNNTRRKDVL